MNRISELYAMVEAAIERAEQHLQELREMHDAWKREDASPPTDDEEAPCDVVWMTREDAAKWVGLNPNTIGKRGADGILPRRKNQDGRWIYALPIHRYSFDPPPAGHSWQTFGDAAKCLGISTTTLQTYAKTGKIVRQRGWYSWFIYAVPCEQTAPPSKIEDGLLNL